MGRKVITRKLVSSRSPSCETMSVSHHHHLSAQRIFKDSSLHFAFRANTFLMLLPLRPHPPSIQQPQLPISKGKTKAGKQGNEGISFGSAFWALTLTEADLSGFARLLLDSLSTAATSLWIFWNVVWKVAIDHLRILFFFFFSLLLSLVSVMKQRFDDCMSVLC